VILTAIKEEYLAVKNQLSDIHEDIKDDTIYETGIFVFDGNDIARVIIRECGAKNVVAAQETERAIIYFAPQCILFVGIAGSRKPANFGIGDVIFAEKIYSYEGGKSEKGYFKARPDIESATYTLLEIAKRERRSKDWHVLIKSKHSGIAKADTGVVASGEQLVEHYDSDIGALLAKHYDDTSAVEMEGFGFARTAIRQGREMQGMIIGVVRGISDILEGANGISNGTPGDRRPSHAKELAADNAAAFAFWLILKANIGESGTVRSGTGHIISSSPHIQPLREFLQNQLSEITCGRTIFDIRVLQCDSYNEMVSLHKAEASAKYEDSALPPLKFLHQLDSNRRTLLQAPGGAGKTQFILRLLLESIEGGFVPFLLDFSKPMDRQRTIEEIGFTKSSMKGYFTQYCQCGGLDHFEESARNSQSKILLVVDALNQQLINWSKSIDLFTQWISQEFPSAKLLVVDRLVRRDHYQRFAYYTVLPLPRETVLGLISHIEPLHYEVQKKWIPLLSSPFFLQLKISTPISAHDSVKTLGTQARIELIMEYIRKSAGVGDDDMLKLGAVARKLYEHGKSTSFDRTTIEDYVADIGLSSTLVENMLGFGALMPIEGKETRFEFKHQLIHDGLVAIELSASAGPGDTWNASFFDNATLHSASFDALELSAELIVIRNPSDHSLIDTFLIELYDWRFTAARNCIDSLLLLYDPLKVCISEDLVNAIMLLTAEKRFDRFNYTSKRAQGEPAHLYEGRKPIVNLDSCDSIDEFVLAAKKHNFSEFPIRSHSKKWSDWRNLYCQISGNCGKEHAMLLLEDPILSWTAANVLRRNKFVKNDAFLNRLVEWYSVSRMTSLGSDQSQGFRWRIVHVLGSSNRAKDIYLMIDVARDKDEFDWVRYGAARSAMEAFSGATLLPKQRKDLLSSLFQLIDDLVAQNYASALPLRAIRQCTILRLDASISNDWYAEMEALLLRGMGSIEKVLGQTLEYNEWATQLQKVQAIQKTVNSREKKDDE